MMTGLVDFQLFPLACLFLHMAVCRAKGIPMQVPLMWRCVVDELDQSLRAQFSHPTRPPLAHCVPHQQTRHSG